jgi:cytochrome bd-type quinol oxidase subunit 1
LADEVKKNEMGWAYGKCGREEWCVQGCTTERDNLKSPGVGERVFLKWILKR